MRSVTLAAPNDFEGWRNAARGLVAQGVAPEFVSWSVAQQTRSLFADDEAPPAANGEHFTVPKRFVQLAAAVSLHTDADRFALLYRMLWRLQKEPRLLEVAMDEDVHRARMLAKAVQRDLHKMKAFVRFRRAPESLPERYIAWFEPTYHIVEVTAPFFVRRFANYPWAILTPERTAYWDTHELSFGPGARRSDAPSEDGTEQLWREYYASIFNPARLKVKTMRAHMPQKYWRNLPESSLIPHLIDSARERTAEMIRSMPTLTSKIKRREVHVPIALPELENANSLDELRASASACRRCPLYKHATQTVFGEGATDARVVFVGEQPGDQEDLAGKPFVGPAGQLLNRALRDAGIDRQHVYVTNAVKHFKFEPRGKRRIHKKPSEREILACNAWLGRELDLIKPTLIVLLGATAAASVVKQSVAIERSRGIITKGTTGDASVLITVHPSYLLRVSEDQYEHAYARFVEDLQLAAPFL